MERLELVLWSVAGENFGGSAKKDVAQLLGGSALHQLPWVVDDQTNLRAPSSQTDRAIRGGSSSTERWANRRGS